jgi:hypothetical protein
LDLRKKLLAYTAEALLSKRWHWYQFHFSRLPVHPFASSLIDTLATCEEALPGFAEKFITALAGIADKERDEHHYDQLVQRLSELLILQQCLREWPGAIVEVEPSAPASVKRPDIVVTTGAQLLVIEIKAPAITKLGRLRVQGGTQLVSRTFADPSVLQKAMGSELVLPRDNAVKDFLLSADAKFAAARRKRNCLTLLVILWDDFIHEVISALTHEGSGLLTPNSFAKGGDGQPIQFHNIDGIVVVRHLHNFVRAAGDRPLLDRAHAFDFGNERDLPNVLIPNPVAINAIPVEVAKAFRAVPINDDLLSKMADYRPKDLIWWI